MSTILRSLTVALFGVYLLKLVFLNQILLYINPRYTGAVAAAGLLCVAVGLVGLALAVRPRKPHSPHRASSLSLLGSFALALTLTIAFAVPPKAISISAGVAPTRATPDAATSTQEIADFIKNHGNDSSKYSFADWFEVNGDSFDYSFQDGKAVDIVGVAFKSRDFPEGTFAISRNVIYCCVIDATPYGILVQASPDLVNQNSWIDLKGHFKVEKTAVQELLEIIPDQIIKVSPPVDPYIYWKF